MIAERQSSTQVVDAHLAVLTQQVAHYHAARFRAARNAFRQLTVVSVANSADFSQFFAKDDGTLDVARVCDGIEDYMSSIASGTLWDRVEQALERCDPDVVAIAGWSFSESLAAIAWAKKRKRSVLVMSESQAHDGVRSTWREAVKHRVVQACDAGLVGGETHRVYATALGVPSDRIFLGYDAVDNDHFAQGAEAARDNAHARRAELGLPDRYLLASARFIGKKNLPRLVSAFGRALAKLDRGHKLVLLGDGPERPDVEAAIAAADIAERVILPGFQGYDDLPAFYGLAEGFAHVSLSEQWGLVINEAAAAGLPLILSRRCGAAATMLRDGENGWLVDPSSDTEIAEALTRTMALAEDQRNAMGSKSARIVAAWGPDRFADGLRKAAVAALERPRRDLRYWDRALFRQLSRQYVTKVS